MGKVKQWAEDMAEEYLDELIKNVKNKVLTVHYITLACMLC